MISAEMLSIQADGKSSKISSITLLLNVSETKEHFRIERRSSSTKHHCNDTPVVMRICKHFDKQSFTRNATRVLYYGLICNAEANPIIEDAA